MKENLQNIEIKTKTVERTLAPLVKQITTMVNNSGRHRKKRRSSCKEAPQIAKEVELAIIKFIEVGENIARDFPEIKEPMLDACKGAAEAGQKMTEASKEFANNPCDSNKRNVMIRAARILLTVVTKLITIADMADVFRLLGTLKIVENRLKDLERVGSSDELFETFKNYGDDLMKLVKLTGLRQADLKDRKHKEEISRARAILNKSSRMLLTTSKVYLHHSDVKSAQSNRDYIVNEISGAIATISGVAQAASVSQAHPYEEVGYLANALNELSAHLHQRPDDVFEKQINDELKLLINDIMVGAVNLADSKGTRSNTKEKIYIECENVKSALTNLLNEFSRPDQDPDKMNDAKYFMEKKASDLSKQLKKSVVDHMLDSFLDTSAPLEGLLEAVRNDKNDQFEKKLALFKYHSDKLQEVAKLACNLSTNVEGIKMVKIASKQIRNLCPQVINAALTLSAYPKSQPANENMLAFRDSWLHHMSVLTEAVDDITTIDDFLAVAEMHIFDDANKCVEAMQKKNLQLLVEMSNIVEGRIKHVDHVVLVEMESYEIGPYTEAVKRAVLVMRNNIIAQFSEHVEMIVESIKNQCNINENSFIDSVRLLFEGMRDIRRAVKMKEPIADSTFDSDDDYQNQVHSLATMADEQAKQRERIAYEQLKAGGKVQFEVHSEGLDDPGYQGKTSIMVNGIEYCPRKTGHNVVILDEVGTVVDSQAFDTSEKSGGIALAMFLDQIPDKHIALIAVQDTTGGGIDVATQALKRLGAKEPINPGCRSSWAFAGFSGDHENKDWVSQISRPRYQGPAMISDMINTPASDMGKIHINIHAEGYNVENYNRIASIKINDIELSPMGRGMNIVVLDNAGNYIVSKNFDTADAEFATSEGKRMSKFLNELPDNRIICVASYESLDVAMIEIEEVLRKIGSNEIENLGDNGTYAFVGYTGTKEVIWVDQVSCPSAKVPGILSGFIIKPCAGAELFDDDEVHSKGLSDYSIAFDEFTKRRHSSSSGEERFTSPTQQSARSKILALPKEDKAKISILAEGLHIEQNRLITEVSKWDEQGNDIIILAKKMCIIMMEMCDFARGTGPLKTTADITKAAEKIARSGAKLNRLAGDIAEKCPHSNTRSDLLAYLQRIALYSHQLTITARFKSDVQTIGGEVIVSEVDSTTSLIQSAKNLMNAVMLVVKASYIASTKHKSNNGDVQWRMRVPEKKPLVNSDFYKPGLAN